MIPRSNRSLALFGILAALMFSIVAGETTVAAVGLQEIPALFVARSNAPAEGPPSALASACTVTSPADSGPGTLRTCLENAINGDLIDFNTGIFAPNSPMTITLTSGLPNLDDGNMTIDASNAGVVLDGSQVGSIPEVVLLDDVNLTVDGGPNLIANGDFTSGSGHWRPWADGDGVVRSITTGDFYSSPNSYEWSVLAHSGDPRTAYDTTDTSDPIDGYPLPVSSTVWIPATGGSTVEMSFWFRYGPIGVDLWILYADDNEEMVGDWWYAEADWTPAAFATTLPENAVGVALVFNHAHSERHARGLQVNSSGNTIQGLQVVNFPGTGIGLSGNGNTIGGNRDIGSGPMGQGNLISGNGQWGVVLEGASANTISGNYIGTNISGTAAFGNAWMGVTLNQGAQHNLVGGDSAGEGNLISGNGTDGMWILDSGTDYNTISGNLIGTNIDGMAAIPNGGFGIFVRGGAQYNTIGGDTPQERNLVSGNGNCGVVLMDEGTDRNVIRGNYIGTDANGTTAIPNPTCGVGLWGQAQYNTVGGSNTTPGGACSGPCNLISGNGQDGIHINGGDAMTNTVSGNYIGVDATGSVAVPNEIDGIIIENGASQNLVGGDMPGERNIISGNGDEGIRIRSGSDGNIIRGNYVGTDASGTIPIGNAYYGIEISSGYNIIGGRNISPGGACSGECNLVSGNYYGIQIVGSGAVSNTITGNYVGTDASGTVLIPGLEPTYGANLFLGWDAAHNQIGGAAPGQGNVIAGMLTIGPPFSPPAHNHVAGNHIGLDATGTTCLARSWHGISLSGWKNVIGGDIPAAGNRICGADHHGISISNAGNLVGYNEIFGNRENGVQISGATVLTNTLTHNSVHDNGQQGIDLVDGGNDELRAPVVLAYDVAAGTASGTACALCTVEVFSDDSDEGRWYEGAAAADALGDWAFSKGAPFTGANVHATATDADGNTSEFSRSMHDVAVVGVAPSGEVPVGQASSVRAELLNEGSQLESNVPVRCSIQNTGYDENRTSGEVPPATWSLIEFPAWTPSAAGIYTLTCQSILPGDENPDNDTFTQVVTATLDGPPDVWTKDNNGDTGDVPSNHPWWVSPDIWVRHQDDHGLVHQNPIAFENNTVYVRLHNRGSRATSGEVQVFWDRSRIGWPCKIGQPNVGTIPFEDLPPGEVRIVSLQWEPQEVGHHGLHTMIQAEGDPADWSAPCSPHLPRWDNNVSWHNVIVYIHPPDGSRRVLSVEEEVVDLVNVYDWPKDVDLIVERGTFPATGAITLRLDEGLFDRWWSYEGRWYEDVQVDAATRVITVTGEVSATIGSLPLDAEEEVTATLAFDAPDKGAFEARIHERIDGLVVGGISYQWIDSGYWIYLPLVLRNR